MDEQQNSQYFRRARVMGRRNFRKAMSWRRKRMAAGAERAKKYGARGFSSYSDYAAKLNEKATFGEKISNYGANKYGYYRDILDSKPGLSGHISNIFERSFKLMPSISDLTFHPINAAMIGFGGNISRAQFESMGGLGKFMAGGESIFAEGAETAALKGGRRIATALGAFGGKLLPKAFFGLGFGMDLAQGKGVLRSAAHTGLEMTVGIAAFEAGSYAAGAAAAGLGMTPLGWGIAAGAGLAYLADKAIIDPIDEALQYIDHPAEKWRKLKRRGFNSGFKDTRGTLTMRQRSLQAIQRSHMSARQFVLGNEATMLSDM